MTWRRWHVRRVYLHGDVSEERVGGQRVITRRRITYRVEVEASEVMDALAHTTTTRDQLDARARADGYEPDCAWGVLPA